MLFSIEDNIFTLTMFWTTSIYLGSFFGQHGYNAIFLDIVMLYFVDI
jgi:hypothetical protein